MTSTHRTVGWIPTALLSALFAVTVGLPTGFGLLVFFHSKSVGLWLAMFPIAVGIIAMVVLRRWHTSASRRIAAFVGSAAVLLILDSLVVFGGLHPPSKCTWEFSDEVAANTELAPNASLADDGRGQFSDAVDGVDTFIKHSLKLATYEPQMRAPKSTRRHLRIDLSRPVSGSGAVPLGVLSASGELKVYWYQDSAGMVRTVHAIPQGTTVASDRTDIRFDINGRAHRLTMGRWRSPYCDAEPGIHGVGTTDVQITRTGPEDFTVDASGNGKARLWDISESTPKNKGLYYFTLHARFLAKK